MTTWDNLPPRQKSQRLMAKQNEGEELESIESMEPIANPVMSDLYPGLNDITDAFEAFPMELVRYFTLIKEIDAKCVNTVPYLKAYIGKFLEMKKTHPKRAHLLSLIRDLIKELMPCMEEKMQVATLAADTVRKHLNRIDDDFVLVERNEIPASIRIGPLDHPAIVSDSKLVDPAKSAQAQRSELRRTTLAAKKANQTGDDEDSAGGSTPAPSSRNKKTKSRETPQPTTTSKKRKTTAPPPFVQQTTRYETPELEERPPTPPNKRRQTGKKKEEEMGNPHASQEPLYCYCQQVSYGEMVACDGSGCTIEWFHLPCTGLNAPPKGKWYCNDCKTKMKKR